ncbi:MAG: uroporphyrinogen-III C-methyltransferase [Rhodospirillaceae bacterium]
MVDQPITPFSELVFPVFESGWVWLAGAGPGDPGLLTLHAMHALRNAEVVLYDALIDKRVLAMARPTATLIDCGKRGGLPSCKQEDICAQLVELARLGRRVLRLKGGDPLVFGRGAEELLALVAAGVRFRVIPGVSAGLGGLAYAGIPLTCRGINEAATFITGHDVNGKVPDLDWGALARGSPVLVLFMALRNLHAIVPLLLAGGRPFDEPVAFVRNATTPRQQVIETTLGQAAAVGAGVEPPALVVIGEVVRLRASLDWLGRTASLTDSAGL